jgi:hypothetical protein
MGGERRGRSTPRLIADTFGLYRRYPLLFFALAAAVIVPYELIVLAVTGDGGSTRSNADVTTELVLTVLDLFLVASLVSALHVHGVADVRRGEEPRFGPIARRGLAALPVVCAATIMATFGIFLGSLLIVPGLILWIRWLVVAQAAAIERDGWIAALRRSWALTQRTWLHALVFLVCITLIAGVPAVLLNLALADQPTTVATFLAGTLLTVIVISFSALATGLLYFDLRTRRELLAAASAPVADPDSTSPAPPPVNPGIDPRAYSDSERPRGWYVNPDQPRRMLYWDDGDPPGWRGETRTPRKLRRRWEEG